MKTVNANSTIRRNKDRKLSTTGYDEVADRHVIPPPRSLCMTSHPPPTTQVQQQTVARQSAVSDTLVSVVNFNGLQYVKLWPAPCELQVTYEIRTNADGNCNWTELPVMLPTDRLTRLCRRRDDAPVYDVYIIPPTVRTIDTLSPTSTAQSLQSATRHAWSLALSRLLYNPFRSSRLSEKFHHTFLEVFFKFWTIIKSVSATFCELYK